MAQRTTACTPTVMSCTVHAVLTSSVLCCAAPELHAAPELLNRGELQPGYDGRKADGGNPRLFRKDPFCTIYSQVVNTALRKLPQGVCKAFAQAPADNPHGAGKQSCCHSLIPGWIQSGACLGSG